MPAPSLAPVGERLERHFGPQPGPPAGEPWQRLVAAVLKPGSTWAKVTRALAQFQEDGICDARALCRLPWESLLELLRPAGGGQRVARRLQAVLEYLMEHFDGDAAALLALAADDLASRLSTLRGVGPETADSVVLFAAEQPRFVVQPHAYRVLVRHGWLEPEADYQAVRTFLEDRLAPDATRWQQWSELLARLGEQYCRREPLCDGCPLADLLPDSGPCTIEPTF